MSDEVVRVRRAGTSDAPAIASVLRAAFAAYESLYTRAAFAATVLETEDIERRLEEGPIWVALLHEAVVGTVSAVSRGEALYVRSMAVVPEVQGQGVGGLLLRHLERFASECGIPRLVLSTMPFLSSAMALYDRSGFCRSDGGPHDLFGMPLFTMTKVLPPPQGGLPTSTQ